MAATHILQGPKLLYPVPDISFGKFIYQSLKSHGNKIAQIDAATGETRTFSDMLSNGINIADNLYTRGVRPGDAVGICCENSLDFILPVIATNFIGATCATLNPNYSANELHHALSISKPKIIFCSETSIEKIEKASKDLGISTEIVVFGFPLSQKHVPFKELLIPSGRDFEPIDVDPKENVAAIMCSSGTTGLPKGVMLTQYNFLYVSQYLRDHRFGDVRPDDTMLAILPMFHAFMYIMQLIGNLLGAKIVVMKRFDEQLFLKTIEHYKVNIIYVVPPVMVFLAKATIVEKYDLSSLRDLLCGAAPLKEETEAQAANRLDLYQIRQGYGLTEITLAVTISPPDKRKPGSSGVLVPETDCKVVDLDNGKSVGPNQNGELCFRSPGIMKGYCGNIEATSAMMDADGFLHTGDVGYYDEEGFFYVVDRVKELIKYKGFQVPPAELEALLLTHPAIKEAAVVGKPDEKAGELPMAFVVKQPNAKITKEEIIKFVADQVSTAKWLRGGVEFTDSIPKTPSGKILRRELRKEMKAKL